MTTAHITTVGNDVALVFSKETAEELGMRVGEEVQVVPTSEGMTIRRGDAIVKRQLEVAEQIMEKRRDVLRKLAE